jgi:hypothetical protein
VRLAQHALAGEMSHEVATQHHLTRQGSMTEGSVGAICADLKAAITRRPRNDPQEGRDKQL